MEKEDTETREITPEEKKQLWILNMKSLCVASLVMEFNLSALL